MQQLTDEKIMDQVKGGQMSELTLLFDRYNIPLYNFFLKLTQDKSSSEDLTQNLFYRLIRYRASFNSGSGSFKAWIYQMARNLHADYCKDEKRITAAVKSAELLPEVADISPGFKEQDFEQLNTALGGLGPVDRELILMSRFEGMKYAEIAKMKNISVGAVKVQAHRALNQLRILYFKQANNDNGL